MSVTLFRLGLSRPAGVSALRSTSILIERYPCAPFALLSLRFSSSRPPAEESKGGDEGHEYSSSYRVLSLYRKLLRQASRLPEAKNERADAIARIKKGFREARDEKSPERVQELLKKATSQLSYLRIVTPKHSLADESNVVGASSKRGGGKQRWVWHNGELVSAEDLARDGKGPFNSANNAGVNAPLDSNDVRRHVANLRRFQFMGDKRIGPPPKGLLG